MQGEATMSVINNAIAWGQFRLLGGWRNLLLTGGVYALLGVTTMFAFVRGTHQPASATYGGFVTLFMSLQVMAMLFYGTVRVGNAVRMDARNRIIESHRMMPIAPGAAVVGYLLGAPIQALLVFAINFALGAAAVAGAGLPLDAWAVSNAVLLAFCLCLWMVVLFFSFRTAWAMWAGIVLFFAFRMSSGMLLRLLPGATILITPLMGHTIFDMRSGATAGWPYAVAVFAQAIIGLLYFYAAMKRYLRDDAIGFGPIPALLLLATWVGISVLGTLDWNAFRMSVMWRSREDLPVTFIVGYGSVLLLAILPVSSAVRMHFAGAARGAGRQLILPVVVLAASAIVMGTVAEQETHFVRMRTAWLVRTALVTLAFLLSMRYLLGIVHRIRWRPRLVALGWLLLTWCVPLLAEFAWEGAASNDPQTQHLTQIALCSPVAEVYQVWSREPLVHTDGFAGLAVQCGLAVLLGLLNHTVFRRRASDSASPSGPVAISLPPAVPGGPAGPTPAVPAPLK
jgi:hypothetical protein